jgi:uncharacterized protein YjaG (DUF416 family)
MKKTNKPIINFTDNGKEYLHLSSQQELILDSSIQDIEGFMSSNVGKGKSEEEKEELYGKVTQLWKDYATSLKETKYNFYLNKSQWKFLNDLISVKLEYDVNTVFFAIELTELLKEVRNTKILNDTDILPLDVDATQITYIYHLIATYKPKGLTKDTYTFSEILLRIGEISKIFNYYNMYSENLSTDVTDWVSAFEEGVTLEQRPIVSEENGQIQFEEVI